MRTVRVFVSSPGDAIDERKRVVRVIERLNAAFAGVVTIERVLWEERFYSAHDGFQPQIARSADCDIVVAILRGRLGTALPPEFAARLPKEERLPELETYSSGTAYEILSAIAARRRGAELPDIFVFRYPRAPSVKLDAPDKAEIEAQWEKLKSFAEQVFVSAEGHFKGAYQTFSSTEDFEAKAEGALRQWLSENVLKGRAFVWPIATKGSPFRGLEPFGAKHADVFFGRDGDRNRALDRLKDAAEAGFPFLLIVGPSGAGKSSFARAGILPWLVKPGSVTGVSVWRTAVMRPSDHPDGAIASLTRHLFDAATDIAEPETGRPIALPELALSDSATPQALAGLFSVFARGRFERSEDLENAGRAAMAPIEKALKFVAEAERKAWNSEKEQPAWLLVVVDQLDELFAAGIDDEARAAFARLLDRLARTGLIWIVTTLRAEFYESFLKSPLAHLASPESTQTSKRLELTFDLLPPGLAEMAEVVRGPARAAGLEWEIESLSKERLDERLINDIDRPDLLPLVQFVLDRLYEQRAVKDETVTLTFDAYRALGTLDGAIDMAAERALSALGPAERTALPRLMRVLMTYAAPTSGGGKGAAALRQTPRLLAAHDEASAWLVAALIDARILVSGYDQNKVPIIALAHQRVIEAWKRARTIVAESENLLRIRDEVEEARRRWEESGQRRDRLIPVGLPLSEAENAAATLQDELPVETRAYIEKSGRAARLRQRMTAAAAVVFLAVAAAAVFFGKEAGEAAREARQQTQLAEQAANESQKQTHLTEQRSAMLTADVARSLTTEGSLDQALLLMLDSGRLFDDKSVPDEIRIAFTKTLEKKSRIETKTLFPNMQVFETDAALLLVNRETNEIFKLTDSVSPSRLVEGSTGDSPILSLRQSVKGDEVIVLRKNLEVERIDMKRGSRRKVGVFSEPKEYPGRVYNKPDWTEPEITANDLVVRGSKNSSQIMDSETGRIFEREMTGTTGAHINKSVDTRLHHVACIGDMNSAVKASVFKELRESTAFPGVSISCKKFASTRTLMDTGGDRYLFTVFTSGSSGLWRSDKLFDDDGTMTNIQQMFSKNNLTDSDFAWVGVQERFGGSTIGVLFNRDAVVREAPDGDVKVNYRHPTIVTHARFSGRDRFIVVESEIGRVVAHDFGSTPRRSDTLFSTPTQSIIGTEKPSKTLHHGDCVGFSSLFPRAHSDILPDDRKIFYPAPGKHEIRVVNDKDTVVINLDEAYCIQFSADWKRMLGLQPSGVRIYDFDRVIASRSLAEGEIGMIPLSEPPTSGFFVGQSGDAIVTADDSNRVLLWKRDANNAKWVKTEVFHGEHSVLYAEPDADGERLLLIENVAVGSSEIHGFLYSIRARQEWFDLGNDYKFFGAAFTDNSEVVVSKHWTWTNVFPVLPLSALVALANKELSPECRPPHEGNFKSSPCWPSSYQ